MIIMQIFAHITILKAYSENRTVPISIIQWVNKLICFCSQIVSENFIAPLLEAVLLDYKRGVPASREPEVLGTMATIVSKLGVSIL